MAFMDKKKKFYFNRWTLAVLAVSAGLDGCSFLDIGENEYRCPNSDNGIGCVSARQVYQATNGDSGGHSENEASVASVTSQGGAGSSQIANAEEIADPLRQERRDQIDQNWIAPSMPDRPVPVRTPSGVMRIWIASWEDESGDLHIPGNVYAEIEPRRWVIGEREEDTPPEYFIPTK